jgi:hypothetical protein
MRSPFAYRARDALDLLQREHDLVRKLLCDYDHLHESDMGNTQGKAQVVEALCDVLSQCAQIEEELFYPLVRTVLDSSGLARTLLCDHALLRRLIARLDELEPTDAGYDTVVADVKNCVLPSMNHAQAVLFETLRGAGLDMLALRDQMLRRRRAQQQQDLTRIGMPLPRSTEVIGAWPPACRMVEM